MELFGKWYELHEVTDIIALGTFLEEIPLLWTLMDS